MKNKKRAGLLEPLSKSGMHESGFEDRQKFIDWSSEVAPLLNFSPPYYNAFQECVRGIHKTGLSSGTYTELLAHAESIVLQAVTELKHDISPIQELTDEHDPIWFWTACTLRSKVKIFLYILAIVSVVGVAAYNLGTNKTFHLIVDSASSPAEIKASHGSSDQP
tara:strand:- start:105 stop:596 length:492 start_codon:yes stop_codon:yes gene_type:complete